MHKKTIELTVGIPGSGKSTYAEKRVANSKGTAVRINKDDLRAMHYPDQKFTRHRESAIIRSRDVLVMAYLNDPTIKHIIIDDTNLHKKHLHRMNELMREHLGVEKIPDGSVYETFMYDSENVELCHRRNEARGRTVPHTVIENMYRQWKRRIIEDSGLDWPLINKTGIPAIVCDIDGTLAIRGKRNPFDWSRVGEDTLNRTVAQLLRTYAMSHHIILMSGRDIVCREETEEWLEDHDIPYFDILMRPEKNTEPDYKIKQTLYQTSVYPYYRVDLVVDDRMQVVRLWRAMGLECFQVADGYF